MNRAKSIEELEKLRETIIEKRKVKKTCITVCNGTGCHAYGCEKITQAFADEIKKQNLTDKEVEVRATGCHGFCERGPIVVIQPEELFYQRIKIEDVPEIISKTIINGNIIDRLLYVDPTSGEKISREREVPFYKRQQRIIFGSNGLIDPTSIEDYLAIGGYKALGKALTEITPEQVIEEVTLSGLRGRGGAGFPTGLKWKLCRANPGNIKYIICNADEGDPGAYMDRSLLEGNPHSIIEGMIIGAYAIGSHEGYIFVRREYPLAVQNATWAIEQAEEYGLLGENILGSGFSFAIHIVKGAGAFVCGEESALMTTIEGKVGEPTQRPPYPAQKGLWRKPTVINNVETWANISHIINRGGKWFASLGTEKSKGTKIFSLVGKVNNTGLVEVPMGITLRSIVFDIGGGIPKRKRFKAVQIGGPSGGCIPENLIDLPVDYESLTGAGAIMGSGGLIVMDEDTCMVDIAKYFTKFLHEESCGKCYTCRKGLQRMHEILSDITEGRGKEGDIELLEELALVVKDTTMCGLGQTSANPVLSTIHYFMHEYEEHIKYKKCRAAVCTKLISSPCQHTCPIDTEAPVYIALIAKGQFDEAYDIIIKDNPLPSVCGRVCSRPCEFKCRAGMGGDPISIRALKRFATDYAKKLNIKPKFKPVERRGQKVAIIGSGPAGLTAGYYLARNGYQVTVFESQKVAGGMLALAIPEFRLPRKSLEFDLDAIKDAGVEIKTNVTIGKDIDFNDLFDKLGFNAVFIATGAHKSFSMGIPGEDAKGVIEALELLRAVNLGEEVKVGKRIGIIGGGNAAIDAARVAFRMPGCEEVTIIYRRTRAEMPAFSEEVDEAIEEGINIKFLAAPTKIITKNGKLTAAECIKMKLGDFDASGRRRPVPIEGSEFILNLDTMIMAIGEQPDLSFMNKKHQIEISPNNRIIVDPETLSTNRTGVFAGGDVVTGPYTVVEAISAGKIAAESIDRYLKGESLQREYKVTRPCAYIEPVELTDEELGEIKAVEMPSLPVEKRVKNFKEVELGFDEKMAVKEARRCLRCELELKEEEAKLKNEVTA
ncbi:MAG: FAD-dependent oxidoreductase [Candidatus Aminicenantes bacterium]|nr:FAD-dependent oxidoreductase [Candidatus Aminicenantes bacterium]MDH5715381.1 FAD-dependent oxidoreductase [Candidatus Aminicenantes bacterium]